MQRILVGVGIVCSLFALLLVGSWLLGQMRRSLWLRIPVVLLITYGWLAVGLAWTRYLDLDLTQLGIAWLASLSLLGVTIAWRRYHRLRHPVHRSFLTKLSPDEFKTVTRSWGK